MTNDLNNIPASVRDALEAELRVMHQAKVYEVGLAGGQTMEASYARQCMWRLPLSVRDNIEQALPLIEKLCQPNIVIVDLDDGDLEHKIYEAILSASDGYMSNDRIAKSVIAALKEKTND
jgi:hypothetical protein